MSKFKRSRAGQSAVEYAILISIASIALLFTIEVLDYAFAATFYKFIYRTKAAPPSVQPIGGTFATRQPTATPDMRTIIVNIDGPVTIEQSTNGIFDGSLSVSPSGSIVSYEWTVYEAANPANSVAGNSASISHNFQELGAWNISLKVTDDRGSTNTKIITVNVYDIPPENSPPIAVVNIGSPLNGDAPLTVQMDGSSSNDDKGIVTYEWRMNGSSIGNGPNLTYDLTTPGTYVFELIVYDAEGESNRSDPIGIGVSLPATPTPTPTLTPVLVGPSVTAGASPDNGSDPLIVSFTATATDDVGINRYEWSFGDGFGSNDQNPTYVYNTPGTYNATVTVYDTDGLTATDTVTIVVQERCSAPSSPWAATDLGDVDSVGETCQNGGAFTLTRGGYDIWGNDDEFHFAYQNFSNSQRNTIIARITNFDSSHDWAKAGIMIRDDNNDSSRHAFFGLSGNGRLQLYYRENNGGSTTTTGNLNNQSAPIWLRLVRTKSGNDYIFTASYSSDGSNWNTLSSFEFDNFGNTTYLGLAVSSHVSNGTAEASFDNVSVTRQ